MKHYAQRSFVATLILSSGLSVGLVAQTTAAAPGEQEKKTAAVGGAEEKAITLGEQEKSATPVDELVQADAPAAPAEQPPPPATPAAPAPTPAAPEKKEAAPALETIVVTGSNVPTTPDAVAVPVSILGSDQIEQNGVTSNVLEVLRKSLPSFAGRSNAGNSNANNTNQNTAGGSQVQLRNLDTLVLINGRRVATSGINALGGKSFVDINQIPTAAIDRIEVLTDGSSAIYGSDAIGGVVNIILKTNYKGAEVGGRYAGASGSGNYTEQSGYFVGGIDLAKNVNLTVSASSSHTDPLYQKDRPFSTPLTGRVSLVPGTVGANNLNPGAILASNLNSPRERNPTGTAATATSVGNLIANGTYLATTPAGVASTFDLSSFQTLLLKQDQDSFVSTLSADVLGKKLVAFGDFMYSKTKSYTQFLPITTTGTVPAGAPFNPLTAAFPQVTFGYLPDPHQFFNEAKATRVTAGLRGDLAHDWNWEGAYVYSDNLLDQAQTNLFYVPNIARAIAGGFDAQGNAVAGGGNSRVASGFSETNSFVIQPALDPFARAGGVNPASVANLLGTEHLHAASRLQSIDLKLAGTAFDLPADKLGIAVGTSFRRETLAGEADQNGFNTGPTGHRWLGGTLADPFASSRRIDAAFFEARVPITGPHWNLPGAHAFDLIGAVRAEHYSDVGNSTVPKLGFRWQPVDAQFTMRGTYAKSFTAPTLFAMSGPTDTRQVGSAVIQSVFGLPGLPFNGEDGNNPDLKPSKSTSKAIGFVFKPAAIEGLKLSVDYSNVKQDGFPGGIGFANILQSVDRFGSASPFSGNIALGNFPGLPGAVPFAQPGQLGNYLRSGGNPLNVYAIDRFMNLGGIKEQSINMSAEYELPTDKLGNFTFSTTGAMFLHYKFQALPDQPFFEYAGYATNGGTGVQGTLPKYRFYSTVDWQYQNWDVTLGNTYISSVTDIGPGGIVFATSSTLKPVHVSSYVAWDLRTAYTDEHGAGKFVKSWTLAAGINNIANRMPPLAQQAFSDNNADVSTYSPIGRLVYVTGSMKF
jgi:iron complex outermembrane recepter protein